MILAELIQKGGLSRLMAGGVAEVANVAVAAARNADSIREWWSERAGIMEHDGGIPTEDAERLAWARTLARFELPASYRLH